MEAWARQGNWHKNVIKELPAAQPDASKEEALEKYQTSIDRAAGDIFLMLESDQYHHVAGLEDDEHFTLSYACLIRI